MLKSENLLNLKNLNTLFPKTYVSSSYAGDRIYSTAF